MHLSIYMMQRIIYRVPPVGHDGGWIASLPISRRPVSGGSRLRQQAVSMLSQAWSWPGRHGTESVGRAGGVMPSLSVRWGALPQKKRGDPGASTGAS